MQESDYTLKGELYDRQTSYKLIHFYNTELLTPPLNQLFFQIIKVLFFFKFDQSKWMLVHQCVQLKGRITCNTYFETPALSLNCSTAPAQSILLSCPLVGGIQYNITNGVFNRPSSSLKGYDRMTYLGEVSGNSSTNSSMESIISSYCLIS